MKKNKYIKGENIKSLDEFCKQEFVFYRDKLYHFGWFWGWQIRFIKQNLDSGNIFYAKKVINDLTTKD